MNTLLVSIVAIAVVAFVLWVIKTQWKKEKFTMKLYRPNYSYDVPENTWDPADILTTVLPTGMNKPPELSVELGDYRRFQRI
ncbi:hypothetical protein ATCVNEJV2_605L [Acanthocystis turfacea Chlorella virus NE-JV-2]|nr:hypothetical protein ATCVCan0610SP_584L [Acanthocystis turfacea Chlorella virus Can0610SP]AGE56687.1 hypothetical protein ATCVNEJV2_605L [Acanthocystis turfacea Chlorella virus NE-JV-2]AGE59470.1 hypothetical protein ATCVOR07043_572L [Acanthocystis turfacea Chlorella virus OR0704.3]